jgi:hypothetical protein
MDKLIGVLQSLPHLARRSITFDRGTEFTDWPYLQAGIGAQTWFCDPNRPGRKAPWKIPIAGPASGCRERSIRPLSSTNFRYPIQIPNLAGQIPICGAGGRRIRFYPDLFTRAQSRRHLTNVPIACASLTKDQAASSFEIGPRGTFAAGASCR